MFYTDVQIKSFTSASPRAIQANSPFLRKNFPFYSEPILYTEVFFFVPAYKRFFFSLLIKPLHPLSIVDDFIDAEKAKMTWWDRVLFRYPDIRTTQYHAVRGTKSVFSQEEIIRPSITLKIQVVIILFFLGLAWIAILRALSNNRFPLAIFMLAFLFITFVIGLLVRNYFISKKYNYTISITASRIAIDETKFLWDEIAETCIMSRQEGKTTNNYLIIFKKDKSIEKYDLWMFGISNVKLSSIIEHFKKQR